MVHSQLPLFNKGLDNPLARNLIKQKAMPSFHRLENVSFRSNHPVKIVPNKFRPHDSVAFATYDNELFFSLPDILLLPQIVTSIKPNPVLTLHRAIHQGAREAKGVTLARTKSMSQ
jgi:hypothetical protein